MFRKRHRKQNCLGLIPLHIFQIPNFDLGVVLNSFLLIPFLHQREPNRRFISLVFHKKFQNKIHLLNIKCHNDYCFHDSLRVCLAARDPNGVLQPAFHFSHYCFRLLRICAQKICSALAKPILQAQELPLNLAKTQRRDLSSARCRKSEHRLRIYILVAERNQTLVLAAVVAQQLQWLNPRFRALGQNALLVHQSSRGHVILSIERGIMLLVLVIIIQAPLIGASRSAAESRGRHLVAVTNNNTGSAPAQSPNCPCHLNL